MNTPASERDAPGAADAPEGIRRIIDGWHRLECWIAVAAFSFIAIIMVLDVFGREIVGPFFRLINVDIGPTGIFAAQRLAIFALVIGAFLGVGIATATGSHLVPRVAFNWIPARLGPAMDRIADLLTGIFLLGFVWFGFVFIQSTYAANLRTPVLDWVVWPIQMAIPLGFLSAALRYLVFAAWPGVRPKPPEFQE
ncbi:MAG: TRAP transporter small permease [Rhodospirillales bacterium]|nr:MAG: TRAP transporter small permease [Rhodospirillales bacterium]